MEKRETPPVPSRTENTQTVLTAYYLFKPDGFCKRFRLMIEAYIDQGWTVHYIAVARYPFEHERLIPHILPTPMKSRSGFLFWIYFCALTPWWMLWLGIKHRVSFISVGSPLYALLAGLAKFALGVPLLTFIFITPQSTSKWKNQYRFIKFGENLADRLGLRISDILLANSWASGKAWREKFGHEGIDVLPNNVEEEAFEKDDQRQRIIDEFNLDDDAFLISTSGVLVRRKNHECLIRALARVPHSRAVLLIIGEGPLKEDLKALARELGLENRVLLPGYRRDAVSLVQGSDLFVFPSYAEGMAESLLEAATCRIPCLVSAIPENMDVISDPELHFHPDHPEQAAEQIDRLMQDPAHYQKMLQSTLNDKARFIFDWKRRLVEKVSPLFAA